MTIDEIRRENLRLLIAQYGGPGKLSDITDINRSQLSQWLHAAKEHRTGRPRGMRPESARKIEKACGKAEGWMDMVHAIPRSGEKAFRWPFADIDYAKISALSERDIGKLEASLLIAARDFNLDISNRKAASDDIKSPKNTVAA